MTEQVERAGQVAGVETQLRQSEEVGGNEGVALAFALEDELVQRTNRGQIRFIGGRGPHEVVNGGAELELLRDNVRIRAPLVEQGL